MLDRAIIFAAKKHSGQTRRGNNSPYILHPMRVMNHLYYAKVGTRNLLLLMTACVLHDVVEDCGVTLKEIARLFGYRVAALVEELTTDKAECKRLGKTEYLTRKMLKMSSYALCIKLADRLDNISDGPAEKTLLETRDIVNSLESGRKLTATHSRLIGLIKERLKKHGHGQH